MPRKSKRVVAPETAVEFVPEEAVEFPIVPTAPVEKKVKKTPKFIVASDLHDIIEIMSKADGLSPEQVARKLNTSIERGELLITPNLGTKKK